MNKALRVPDYLGHYDKVDFEIIWRTIHSDLPDLFRLVQHARGNGA